MDSQQQFDACMKQADFYFRSYDTRRQYEWKVTFGIWTLAAVGIAYLSRPVSISLGGRGGLAGALILLHIAWTYRIVKSNWKDQYKAWGYRLLAETVLRNAPSTSRVTAEVPNVPQTYVRGKSDIAFASLPVLGTVILVLASFLLPVSNATEKRESIELRANGGEVQLSVPK